MHSMLSTCPQLNCSPCAGMMDVTLLLAVGTVSGLTDDPANLQIYDEDGNPILAD